MRITTRQLAAVLASTIALAACGGGGGTGPAAPPVPVASAVPVTAPQAVASMPMEISIPRLTPSGSTRSPRFVSPSVAAIAIYDGPTLFYVANLSFDSTPQFSTVYARPGSTTAAFGSCTFTSTRASCSLTITTTIGAHTFGLLTYPTSQAGTPPGFNGVISSEGELSVTLNPGTNPGQTLTMLGVASRTIIAGSANGAYNAATTFGYRINDSTNAQIVLPGNSYDNGPVTITAAPSGMVTINPNSIATPPATQGDQTFDVTCINANGGPVTISFNARTSPNTSYASGLTYSTSNYSGATIGTQAFTCDPSTATIPITVQGKRK